MIFKGTLVALTVVGFFLGAGTLGFGQNAAPIYREAFRYEQRLQTEFPDQAHRYEVWNKVMTKRDFDTEARRYLKVIGPELDQAVEASALPECRWDQAFYQGYVTSLAKCKSLASVLTARMILRSDDGNTEGALGDFMAVIRMSERFEGEYRSTIGIILKRDMQRNAIQEYAKILPEEDKAVLTRLSEFWPGHRSHLQWELGDCFREETQRTFGEIRRQLTDGRNISDIKEWMLKSGGFNTGAPFLEAVKDPSELKPALQELETNCLRIADVLDQQDLDRFNEELQRYVKDYRGKPVIRASWYPSTESVAKNLRVYFEKAKMTGIVTAMFDLAVRRALNGEAALKSIKDPATGRPFIIRPAEPGYVIESEFTWLKKPIQLQVGEAR